MVPIYLHNTLSGRKEEFKPLLGRFLGFIGKPRVGMYHCGPTVYNFAHIGNLRAYVFADTLKRLMKASGYRVHQVINITDVGHLTSDADTGEDKMETARRRERKSAWDIARHYTEAFFEDLRGLNVDTDGTRFPRATDYIDEQIAIVKKLEKKGFAYRTSDGIYFDTALFPEYGKLGKIDLKGIREGQRIGVNEEKKNATDFVLWKFSPAGERREMEWDSPWGKGFPGWHIECSAMSEALLGLPVDIHTGGIDHIPVHHNNEIAQSEAAEGRQFVRYWLHSAFLNVEGGKMAKSEGNFLTLGSLKEKGYDPLAYRYYLLGARYSTPLNFTWEALEAAATAYNRYVAAVTELPDGGTADGELFQKALSYVADDLDTPKALAMAWEVVKSEALSAADKKATLLELDRLLGLIKELPAAQKNGDTLPEKILELAAARAEARNAKNWKLSDDLREQIAALGYDVKDTPEGQKITKR